MLRKLQEAGRYPMVMFENVKGVDVPVLGNALASRDRLALLFDADRNTLSTSYQARQGNLIPPDQVDGGPVKEGCLDGLDAARAQGFDAIVAASAAAWEERWDDCDVTIDGDPASTQAMRFGIYHLLIAANDADPTVNIGAKSLSGEGYRGHVFWDTEILMLPFFVYTRPEAARSPVRR